VNYEFLFLTLNEMLNSTRSVALGLSAGICAIFGYYLFKEWKKNENSSGKSVAQKPVNQKQPEKKRRSTVVPEVDYSKLASAISNRNPNLKTLLKFINEKSAFKAEQERMRSSGCLSNVSKVLWSANNPEIKIMCYKIMTNISTNPDMLQDLVKPIVPLVYEALLQEQENTDVLPNILSLLVNITSHDNVIICDYNLRTIPQILSLYTPQINYQYDIVMSSLKILINMTCAEMDFDLTLVYMTIIHLLHGCKNNAILLRVLTLLRNILKSKTLNHDYTFDDELMRGIGTVLSSNEDKDCLEIANQIYRLISDH